MRDLSVYLQRVEERDRWVGMDRDTVAEAAERFVEERRDRVDDHAPVRRGERPCSK